MEPLVVFGLAGGPLDGVEVPISPFASGKEWLVVLGSRKPPMWRIKQAWELDERPREVAEGRYLYQRSYQSGGKLVYAFIQGSGIVLDSGISST
jgi:hypothetical protein